MTECLEIVDFTDNISLITQARLKIQIRKLAAHDLRWENVIFWGCAPFSYYANKHIFYLENKYVSYYVL